MKKFLNKSPVLPSINTKSLILNCSVISFKRFFWALVPSILFYALLLSTPFPPRCFAQTDATITPALLETVYTPMLYNPYTIVPITDNIIIPTDTVADQTTSSNNTSADIVTPSIESAAIDTSANDTATTPADTSTSSTDTNGTSATAPADTSVTDTPEDNTSTTLTPPLGTFIPATPTEIPSREPVPAQPSPKTPPRDPAPVKTPPEEELLPRDPAESATGQQPGPTPSEIIGKIMPKVTNSQLTVFLIILGGLIAGTLVWIFTALITNTTNARRDTKRMRRQTDHSIQAQKIDRLKESFNNINNAIFSLNSIFPTGEDTPTSPKKTPPAIMPSTEAKTIKTAVPSNTCEKDTHAPTIATPSTITPATTITQSQISTYKKAAVNLELFSSKETLAAHKDFYNLITRPLPPTRQEYESAKNRLLNSLKQDLGL